MHSVAVLAYDGMSGFEAGIASEIFGMSEFASKFSEGLESPWYQLKVCTGTSTGVSMLGGARLTSPYGLSDLAEADTVVIPSVFDVTRPTDGGVIEAIQWAGRRGSRIVSICSGAFALADAGILDGRKATTHWIYADYFRERFPAIEVDCGPLYIESDRVLTSAGCAAGLDLCLHIVRSDWGAQVANDVARRLVVAPHRAGGQAQFVEKPVAVESDQAGPVVDSMTWALRHLDKPLTLDQLAAHASLSRRTYLRQFAQATGTTPIKWLTAARIHKSLELLEATNLSIEDVGRSVGFESPTTFRHHFVHTMRTTPTQYRSTFAGKRPTASESDWTPANGVLTGPLAGVTASAH